MKQFLTKHLALIVIICVALAARMYKITNPVLDWHSFRQADTASVTREYVKHGIDLLHPKYQDLGNIQSGHENPQGYRMVEFPYINAFVAVVVKIVPVLSLEITHRILAIVSSLGALVFLFFLVKEFSGVRVAYAVALVFAVLPYNIYYSRTILPEPTLLLFFTASLYTFVLWLKNRRFHWYVISLIALILALLLKPFIVFFFPVYVVMAYCFDKQKFFKNYWLYIYFVASILPFAWWRQWISQFPEGIPVSHWLFDGDTPDFPSWLPKNAVTKNLYDFFGYHSLGLRYHPAWVRWLGYERLIKLILGYTGVFFLIAAAYKLKKKELYVMLSWWVCIGLYFVVIARGNVQHDYYQVLAVPIIAWTVGRGIILLEQLLSKKVTRFVAFSIVLVLFLSSWYISWKQIRGYYNINHPEYITAGMAVNRLTPPEAKVIAPAFGDTMFLYQTNRTGWPLGYDIDKKIESGASYYISTSYDEEAKMLEKKYFTVEKTPQYILIDLTRHTESQT